MKNSTIIAIRRVAILMTLACYFPYNVFANDSASSSPEHGLDWVLFIIIGLALGTAARHWGKKIPFIRLFPFTVLLMLLGLGLGLADRFGYFSGALSSFDAALNWAANIKPSLILFIFLPTLIFEASFAIDTHTFKKSVVNALILAVPGMIFATILTAVAMVFMLDLPGWTLYVALLFGAIISATDPVAVVALLRELGASKKLSTLIDGESLLNDGVAIVIFTVFLEYIRMGAGMESLDIVVLSQSFLKTVLGGTLIGLIIAATTIAWVRRVFNDGLVEITVLVIAAYLTFYIAEHFLHVSGILGLMALGLVMSGTGRTRISPQVEHFLHNFWEMAAYLANTLIFIIVGVLIAERTVFSARDVINLLLLYVIIHIVRALMIAIFYPLLRRFGYGIALKDTIILWWGALRGALGLCLCLVVMQEPSIPTTIQQQIMFYVAGIVFLTLTINATTIAWIIEKLGLTRVSPARKAMMGNALQELAKTMRGVVLTLQYTNAGRSIRWSAVQEYLPHYQREDALIEECSDNETLAEIRLRLLETERAFYQHEFHEGLLGADSLHALTSGISVTMDDGGAMPLSERPHLRSLWSIPSYLIRFSAMPLLGGLARRIQAQRLTLIYDTAKSCIEAQDALLHLVRRAELYDINQNDTFDENEMQMARKLAQEIQAVRNFADDVLVSIRAQNPDIALAAETLDNVRAALNTELQAIERLHERGMIKLEERQKLEEHVEMQIKTLADYPATLALPDKTEIIRAQPWLNGANETAISAFLTSGEEYHCTADTVLLTAAQANDALYIVVRGEFRSERGEFASIGSALGGYSALSGVAESTTWKAASESSVLRWRMPELQSIVASFPEVLPQLWKWLALPFISALRQQSTVFSADDSASDWFISGTIQMGAAGEILIANHGLIALLAGTVLRRDTGITLSAPTLLQPGTFEIQHQAVVFLYRPEPDEDLSVGEE